MQRRLLALALAAATGAASAQLPPTDPDWRETEVPPPPAVRTTGLIGLDMPRSALRFGVDPASVSVGADGIVRYVVVASSPTGAVNAMYEGIHCEKGDVKVYARYNPDSGWVPTRNPQWQELRSVSNSQHSMLVARSGACMGRAPNGNAAQVVRDLRSGVDRRFWNY